MKRVPHHRLLLLSLLATLFLPTLGLAKVTVSSDATVELTGDTASWGDIVTVTLAYTNSATGQTASAIAPTIDLKTDKFVYIAGSTTVSVPGEPDVTGGAVDPTAAGTTLSWDLDALLDPDPTLATGETATIVFEVRVDCEAATAQFQADVDVTRSTSGAVTEVGLYTLTVEPPSLLLTLSPSAQSVALTSGAEVVWTATVRNVGLGNANNISLRFGLDAALPYVDGRANVNGHTQPGTLTATAATSPDGDAINAYTWSLAGAFATDPDGAGVGLDDLDGDGGYNDLAPNETVTISGITAQLQSCDPIGLFFDATCGYDGTICIDTATTTPADTMSSYVVTSPAAPSFTSAFTGLTGIDYCNGAKDATFTVTNAAGEPPVKGLSFTLGGFPSGIDFVYPDSQGGAGTGLYTVLSDEDGSNPQVLSGGDAVTFDRNTGVLTGFPLLDSGKKITLTFDVDSLHSPDALCSNYALNTTLTISPSYTDLCGGAYSPLPTTTSLSRTSPVRLRLVTAHTGTDEIAISDASRSYTVSATYEAVAGDPWSQLPSEMPITLTYTYDEALLYTGATGTGLFTTPTHDSVARTLTWSGLTFDELNAAFGATLTFSVVDRDTLPCEAGREYDNTFNVQTITLTDCLGCSYDLGGDTGFRGYINQDTSYSGSPIDSMDKAVSYINTLNGIDSPPGIQGEVCRPYEYTVTVDFDTDAVGAWSGLYTTPQPQTPDGTPYNEIVLIERPTQGQTFSALRSVKYNGVEYGPAAGSPTITDSDVTTYGNGEVWLFLGKLDTATALNPSDGDLLEVVWEFDPPNTFATVAQFSEIRWPTANSECGTEFGYESGVWVTVDEQGLDYDFLSPAYVLHGTVATHTFDLDRTNSAQFVYDLLVTVDLDPDNAVAPFDLSYSYREGTSVFAGFLDETGAAVPAFEPTVTDDQLVWDFKAQGIRVLRAVGSISMDLLTAPCHPDPRYTVQVDFNQYCGYENDTTPPSESLSLQTVDLRDYGSNLSATTIPYGRTLYEKSETWVLRYANNGSAPVWNVGFTATFGSAFQIASAELVDSPSAAEGSGLDLLPLDQDAAAQVYYWTFQDAAFASDQDGAGGLADVDGDGVYDDLPAGAVAYVLVRINYVGCGAGDMTIDLAGEGGGELPGTSYDPLPTPGDMVTTRPATFCCGCTGSAGTIREAAVVLQTIHVNPSVELCTSQPLIYRAKNIRQGAVYEPVFRQYIPPASAGTLVELAGATYSLDQDGDGTYDIVDAPLPTPTVTSGDPDVYEWSYSQFLTPDTGDDPAATVFDDGFVFGAVLDLEMPIWGDCSATKSTVTFGSEMDYKTLCGDLKTTARVNTDVTILDLLSTVTVEARNLTAGQTSWSADHVSGGAGDRIEYRVSVLNDGGASIRDIELVTTLPQNFGTIDTFSIAPNSQTGNDVTWTETELLASVGGELASGGEVQLTFQAVLNGSDICVDRSASISLTLGCLHQDPVAACTISSTVNTHSLKTAPAVTPPQVEVVGTDLVTGDGDSDKIDTNGVVTVSVTGSGGTVQNPQLALPIPDGWLFDGEKSVDVSGVAGVDGYTRSGSTYTFTLGGDPLAATLREDETLIVSFYVVQANRYDTNVDVETYPETDQNPDLTQPSEVSSGGSALTPGTVGALTADQWGWGGYDTYGFDTMQVNLGGSDPSVAGVSATWSLDGYTWSSQGSSDYSVNIVSGSDGLPAEPATVSVDGTPLTQVAYSTDLSAGTWAYLDPGTIRVNLGDDSDPSLSTMTATWQVSELEGYVWAQVGTSDVWYAIKAHTADPTIPLDYPQDFTLTYTSTCDVGVVTVADTTTLAVHTPDLDVEIPPSILNKSTGDVPVTVNIVNNGENTYAEEGTALITVGNGWEITAGLAPFAGTQPFADADYDWVQVGTTDVYYAVAANGGGDPGLFPPTDVKQDGASLAGGNWSWGDTEGNGFNTLYVDLGGIDPNTATMTATVPAITVPPVTADTRILVAALADIASGDVTSFPLTLHLLDELSPLVVKAEVTGPIYHEDGTTYVADYSSDAYLADIIGFDLTKSLTSSSEADSSGATVLVGEDVVFTIHAEWFTLDGKTVTGITVSDIVPEGLAFLSYTTAGTANTATVLTGPSTPGSSGQDIHWALDDVGSDTVFEAKVTFRVLNDPLNSDGSPVNNGSELADEAEASFAFSGSSFDVDTEGFPELAARSDSVTVSTPSVTVNKQVRNITTSTGFGDSVNAVAGDELEYRVVVSNAAGRAPAYDLSLTDTLPANLDIQSFASDGVDNDGDGTTDPTDTNEGTVSGQDISFDETDNAGLAKLDPATSITFLYRVTVNDAVIDEEDLDNTATVAYDTLPGLVGSQTAPTGTSGTATGAREYTADDTATIAVAAVDVQNSKRIIATSRQGSISPTAGPVDVVIGEEIRYRLSVQISPQTLHSWTITDTLPAGLEVIQGFDVTLSAPFSSPGTFTPTIGGTDNRTITWDFGDQVLPGGSAVQTVQAELIARVLNVSGNQEGDDLLNSAAQNRHDSQVEALNSTTATIREPAFTVTKTITPDGNSDAGDELTVTVELTNTGAVTAYNVDIRDDLVGTGLTFQSLTVGTDDPTLYTSDPGLTPPLAATPDSNTPVFRYASIAAGATKTFAFTVSADATIHPGQSLANTINVAWTSLASDSTALNSGGSIGTDGASDGMRTGQIPADAGTNDYEASASDSNPVPAVTILKTDENSGVVPTIGAIKHYRLLVTLPESTVQDLVIQDTLPSGMVVDTSPNAITYSLSSIASINGVSSLGDDAAITTAIEQTTTPGTTDDVPQDGDSGTVAWNFGTVVTDQTTSTASATIQIDYYVRIDNAIGVDAGDVLQNLATVTHTDQGTPPTSRADAITVVEPLIVLGKTMENVTSGKSTSASPDGGDTLEYTLTFQNTGTSTAYDVVLTDVLSEGLAYSAMGSGTITDAPSSTTGTGAPLDPQTVIWTTNGGTPIAIASGATATLVYRVTVLSTTVRRDLLTNSATVTWTSLSGSNPDERTAPGSAPNDYEDTASTSKRALLSYSLAKTISATSDSNTTGNDLTIGETVTFDITATFGEGTTEDVTITDNLPRTPGIFAIESAVVQSTGANLVVTGETVTTSDTAPTDTYDDVAVVSYTSVRNTGADDTVTAADQIVVRIVARLVNVIDNQAGESNTNSVSLKTGTSLLSSAYATVNTVEPTLTVTKEGRNVTKSDPTDFSAFSTPDAGDVIEYRLSVENTGGAMAYEIVVEDQLGAGLAYASMGTGTLSTASPATSGDPQKLTWTTSDGSTPISLTASGTATLIYRVTVASTINPSQDLTNDATLTWTSLSGDQGDTERDGDGGNGGADDYTVSDDTTTTTDTPVIDKGNPSPASAPIGTLVTYRIKVTLPEGVTNGLTVTDAIPTGMAYDSYSVVTTAAASGGVLTDDFAGALGANTDNSPTGSGTDLTLSWTSSTVTDDNDAANNAFVIEVVLRVLNISANTDGTTLANTATLDYTGNPGSAVTDPTAPGDVTVVEPVLTLDKQVANLTPGKGVSDAPDAGDILRYTVTVQHDATSTANAYDVVFLDTFDTQTELLLNTDGAPADPAVTFGGTGNATGSLSGPLATGDASLTGEFDIPDDASTVVIVYYVRVKDTTGPADELANDVEASWSSLNGGLLGTAVGPADGERTGHDVLGDSGGTLNTYYATTDTTTTTVDPATIAKSRSSDTYDEGGDATDDDVVRVGDVITYSLDVTLPEGLTNSVVVTDALPTGLEFVDTVSVNTDTGTGTSGAYVAVSPFSYTEIPTTNTPSAGDIGTLTWTLGNITNAGDNSTGNNVFTIVYRARVRNDVTISGTITDQQNTATLNYKLADGTGATPETDTETVVVKQPVLTVAKSSSPIDGSTDLVQGQEVTFTVTIENTGHAPAYDVVVRDDIPAGMRGNGINSTDGIRIVSMTLNDVAVVTPPQPVDAPDGTAFADNGVIEWDLDTGVNDAFTIESGKSLVIVYKANVDTDIGAGVVMTNSASITHYYSFDDEGIPTGSVAGDRIDYGSVGPESVTLTTVTPSVPDKTDVASATIGEEITYTITVPATPVNVPLYDVELTDTLPFYSTNSLRVEPVSASFTAGSDVNASTAINLAGRLTNNELSLMTAADGLDIPADGQAIISLTVRVLNIAENQAGVTFANTVAYTYEKANGGTDNLSGGSDTTANTTILEPAPTIAKLVAPEVGGVPGTYAASQTGLQAGDTVYYKITITNPNGATDATAYDLALSDDLSTTLGTGTATVYSVASTGTVTKGSPASAHTLVNGDFAIASDTLTFAGTSQDIHLAKNSTITVVVKGTLAYSLYANSTYHNSADIEWTSLPGTPTEERTGSGTPAVNDYTVTSPNASVTLTVPSLAKSQATELDETGNSAASQAAIGELVTYTITATVPQGVTRGVTVTDTMSPGLAFRQITSITPSADVSSANNLTGKTFPITASEANVTFGDDSTGTNNQLTLSFGDVTNANTDLGVADTITIVCQAVVLDVSGNTTGTALHNDAQLTYTDGSAVDASQQTVTVVEPTLTVAKTVSADDSSYAATLGSQDAGNTVYYKIVITNGNAASDTRAYDLSLSDTLPAVFTPDGTTPITVSSTGSVYVDTVLGTPAASDFTISSNVLSVTIGKAIDLAANSTLTLVLKGTLSVDTTPNTTYDNSASIQWTSLPGDPGDRSTLNSDSHERTGSGTAPDTYVVTSGTASVSTDVPAFDKALVSSATPTIGDLVTYDLSMTAPEGTTPGVSIVDTLASGLAFVDVVSVTLPSNVTTANAIGTGAGASAGTGPSNVTLANVSGGTANQITFDLGDVVNSNTDDVARDVVIRFRAVVLDITDASSPYGNQAGVVLGNSAVLSYTDGSDLSDSVNVTLTEPTLTVAKTVSSSLGGTYAASLDDQDAGNTVYYKITIANGNAGTDHAAYDLFLKDEFDATYYDTFAVESVSATGGGSTYVDGTPTTLTTAHFAFVSNVLGVASGIRVALDKDVSLDVIVSARLTTSVSPNQTLANLATIRWSSVDQSPTDRSIHNPASDARTGGSLEPAENTNVATADQTVLDNYAATAASADVTVRNPNVSKSRVTVSETDPASPSVTIGEVVRYRLTWQAPEGTTASFNFHDILPAGLTFLNDGSAKVAFVSNGTGLASDTITDAGASQSGNETTVAGLTPTYAIPGASIEAEGGGSFADGTDVYFNLGTLTNSDDDTDQEFVVVEFNAVVSNVATNTNGDTLVNACRPRTGTTDLGTADTSDPSTLTVKEPSVTVAKTVSGGPYDAGDDVTYQIVITAAGTSTAFDVAVTDALNASYFASGSVTGSPSSTGTVSGISASFTGTTLTVTVDSMAVSSTVTVNYTGKLINALPADQEVQNTANLTYTSLPGTVGTVGGANTTGSTSGTAGTTTGERTGAGTSPNTYTDSSGAQTITSGAPTIAKTYRDGSLTDDDSSSAGSTGSDLSIGETMTFDILVTLPEGLTKALAVSDVVPTGLELTSYEVVTTAGTAAGESDRLAADFNGTVTATPTVTPAALPQTGTTVTFTFGDTTTTADGNADNNAFVLRVVATVRNILANQSTTVLTNAASLAYTDGAGDPQTVADATAATSRQVTVVEPVLNITKTATYPARDLVAGDEVTYTITIEHDGSSEVTAYDVVLTDLLDGGSGYIHATSIDTVTPTGGTAADTGGDVAITGGGTGLSGQYDIPLGGTLTIVYTATLQGTFAAGDLLTSTAGITWSSLDGNPTPARDGASGVGTGLDNYAANDSVDVMTAIPTVDKSDPSASTAVIGDAITYSILAGFPAGTSHDLVLTDAIPTGMGYASHSIVTTAAASGGLLTADFDGTLGTASHTIPTVDEDGTDLVLSWDTVTVSDDDDTTDNFILVTLTVDVLNTTGNDVGDTLANTATLTYTDPAGAGTKTATDGTPPSLVTIQEPLLTVTKAFENITKCGLNTSRKLPAHRPQTNDTLRFTLTVENTGTSTAYDVDIADMVDTLGLGNDWFDITSLVVESVTLNGVDATATYDSPTISGTEIHWGRTTGDESIDIAVGESFEVLYTVTMKTLGDNENVTRDVEVDWTSMDGVQSGERTGTGTAPDDYTTTYTDTLYSYNSNPTEYTVAGGDTATIDANGNLDLDGSGPGGSVALLGGERIILTDGSTLDVTDDGLPDVVQGYVNITLEANASATIVQTGNFVVDYLVMQGGGTLTITEKTRAGGPTINYGNLTMSTGDTLIFPDDATVLFGPATITATSGYGNLATIRPTTTHGGLTVIFCCQTDITYGHFAGIDDGYVEFQGPTSIDHGLFTEGNGTNPYIKYVHPAAVTWYDLAFLKDDGATTTIENVQPDADTLYYVVVDGYTGPTQDHYIAENGSDIEPAGTTDDDPNSGVRWIGGTGTVEAVVYYDANGDGLYNAGDGDLLLQGVDVTVTDLNGAVYHLTTDVDGYASAVVAAGLATVDVDETSLPAGYALTTDTNSQGSDSTVVEVPRGGTVRDTTGYITGTTGEVNGTVYIDNDLSGTFSVGDTPLPNVDVVITDSNGGVYTVATDINGYFSQTVVAGNTTVDVTDADLPTGASIDSGSTDPTVVSVPNGGSATDNTGYVLAGGTGLVQGTVYIDNDGSGSYTSGDTTLPNVDVTITDSDTTVYTVTTDANGYFQQIVAAGSTDVDVNDADLPAGIVSPDTGSSDPTTVTVPDGGAATDNTGYLLAAGTQQVDGTVYIDVNGNGVYDVGTDTPVADLTVVVTDSAATVYTLVTDSNGYFQQAVPAGLTTVDLDENDPDYPENVTLTSNAFGQGSDPTQVTVPTNGTATDNTGLLLSTATPAFGVRAACVTPETGGILVQWSARVELGVLKYLVQVAGDGSWTTVGEVFARTEGLKGASYEYLDRLAQPEAERTYRLVCVDVDGRRRTHAVGTATATATAPAAAVVRTTIPTFPADAVCSVEELTYTVQKHATETPAILGTARKASVTTGGLYQTGTAGHVYNLGQELPSLTGGMVYVRPYSDPYTDTNVLWSSDSALAVVGEPGTPPAPAAQGELGPNGYTAIVHVEEDQTLALNSMLPPGPNWFYGYTDRLSPGNAPILTATVPAPASTGTASVWVAVRSTTDGNHDLGITVNSIPVGRATWQGSGHHMVRVKFDLATCPLVDGENQIQLWTTATGSSKRLDYVEIHTPASPQLVDGSLVVDVVAGTTGSIDVPGTRYAVDITEFGSESLLGIRRDGVSGLTAGQKLYFANTAGTLDWSATVDLQALDDALAGKDYVAVAPAAWLEVLDPLVAKHEAEGLASVAVSAEDVYNTYGCGLPTPAALVRLGQRIQPDYLLIGAGASHDPKGLEGDLPPPGIATGFAHVYEGTASTDDLYTGDFSIAVGRLPARSRAELVNMVNKIVDFYPGRRAVMMADVDDATMGYGSFVQLQEQLADQLPSVLLDANTMGGAAMRAALIEQIRGGANLVTYQGHGNNALIGDKFDILNTSEVGQIPPSAWLLATCLTGVYTLESDETKVLASELLRTPGNGAVSVLASTCYGESGIEHQIAEQAVRQIAAGDATWGKVLLHVKQTLLPDETAAIYTLLGDPAMHTLNPIEGDREIVIVAPVAGGFVNGTAAPVVRFQLRGGWWRQSLQILWRKDHGEWQPLKEVTIDPETFDYTIPWDPPPEDGDNYQIMIREITEDSEVR